MTRSIGRIRRRPAARLLPRRVARTHGNPGTPEPRNQREPLSQLVHHMDAWPAELRSFEYQYEVFGCWEVIIRHRGLRVILDFMRKHAG